MTDVNAKFNFLRGNLTRSWGRVKSIAITRLYLFLSLSKKISETLEYERVLLSPLHHLRPGRPHVRHHFPGGGRPGEERRRRKGRDLENNHITRISGYLFINHKISLPGDKQRSRSLSCPRLRCNEPAPGMARRTWTRKPGYSPFVFL